MDGKLYISPVMDCFDGEIVALEMRENMKKELCIDCYDNARMESFFATLKKEKLA